VQEDPSDNAMQQQQVNGQRKHSTCQEEGVKDGKAVAGGAEHYVAAQAHTLTTAETS